MAIRTTIEGYRYKAAMQPYEIHKDLVNQVLTAQTAHDKAAAEAQLKMWEKKYQRETELMTGQQTGLKRSGGPLRRSWADDVV